jgi:ABC-type transport system involved in multi-copper enzyme maturation permease subunit
MHTNIRYILLTAMRDWLFWVLLIGVLFAASISGLLGSTAFIESREMTVTYASGSARVMLMLGLIVFVCFHIRSAFDTKEIDVILSRPISRANLVIAYWLGFMLVAAILMLPIIIVIGLIGAPNMHGFAIWSASLFMEASVVVSLALFSAFALRSAVTSVLVCMGLYVVSRMMVFFVMTAENPMFSNLKYIGLRFLLQAISTVVPRLDFFGKSEWLVYGVKSAQDWQLFILQAMIFVPLLLVASILDFKRKQF